MLGLEPLQFSLTALSFIRQSVSVVSSLSRHFPKDSKPSFPLVCTIAGYVSAFLLDHEENLKTLPLTDLNCFRSGVLVFLPWCGVADEIEDGKEWLGVTATLYLSAETGWGTVAVL